MAHAGLVQGIKGCVPDLEGQGYLADRDEDHDAVLMRGSHGGTGSLVEADGLRWCQCWAQLWVGGGVVED